MTPDPAVRRFTGAFRVARLVLLATVVGFGAWVPRAQADNPPTISDFSPAQGPAGTTVVIDGTNFVPPISITFSGNAAAAGSFTSTRIMVTVPSGALTGPIVVTTANGTVSTPTDFTVGNATPSFFAGQTALGQGVYYLQFPSGNPFGYYSYLNDPAYLYHFDLGYEYVFDANDGKSGVYFYDFASKGYFYTSPGFPFPYLYDFSLNSTVYYYPDPGNPGHYNTNGVRYFYVFNTGQIISK